MLRVSDLRHKDVVNNNDGKRLGFIKDIELDLNEGRIKAIILPGENKLFSFFGHNDDLVIEWHSVKKIGLDVILVELETFTQSKARNDYYEEDEGYYERKEKRRRLKERDEENDYRKRQEVFNLNGNHTYEYLPQDKVKVIDRPTNAENPFRDFAREKLDTYDWSKIKDWGEPKPHKNDLSKDNSKNNPWLKPSVKDK